MTVRPRGDGFQADFTYEGQRYRAQFPSHKEATIWEGDTLAALKAGRPLPKAPTGAMGDTTLTMGELKKKTVAKYWAGTKNEMGATRNAQSAVDYFGANTPVIAITAAKVDEYVTALQERRDSGATINRKLAALSKMMKYAERIEAIPRKPTIERQREGVGRERYLREPEAQAIIDTFRHWGKEEEATFTTFLLDTGARVGEAVSIRGMDVGVDRVTLGATGSKNGEWRVVPTTKRLQTELAALKRGRPDLEKLFHINRWTYADLYRKVVEHLNLGEDVVLHTLRHTCASWLVQRGVDLRRVQVWMGHKSIQTTLRYAKLAPTSLFEAVVVLDNPPNSAANANVKEAA
jgi:integrase